MLRDTQHRLCHEHTTEQSEHVEHWIQRTYSVFLFIEHEGSNSLTSVGTGSSLSMNADGSTANAKMVDSTRNGTRRGRHCIAVM